jgi:RHS repeat-associated protein
MRLAGVGSTSGIDNKYLYNGKELQDEFGLNWLHYGARYYDPQLGRWHVVDPLASENPDYTPYHYTHNAPINRIDPDGLDDFFYNRKGELVGTLKSEGKRYFVENQKNGYVGFKEGWYVPFSGNIFNLKSEPLIAFASGDPSKLIFIDSGEQTSLDIDPDFYQPLSIFDAQGKTPWTKVPYMNIEGIDVVSYKVLVTEDGPIIIDEPNIFLRKLIIPMIIDPITGRDTRVRDSTPKEQNWILFDEFRKMDYDNLKRE